MEYIGRVVYNQDPTFTGRCKVKVFGLFDNMDDEIVPWFTPITQETFSGVGSGSLSVPKIGSIVRVRFHNNDIYSGEYMSAQIVDPALADEIKEDYEGTHVLLYDSEKDLIVIYQPMSGIRIYLGGSMVKVDADGSIQLKHRNNSNVIEVNENDINIITTGQGGSNPMGSINIMAGSTITMKAPTIRLDADDIIMGSQGTNPAVKGTELKDVLKSIVAELGTKYPQTPSPLAGRTFDNITSTDIKLT